MKRWALSWAGLWCAAGALELVGQWSLLKPPPASFFLHPMASLVLATYGAAGLVGGLVASGLRVGRVRWVVTVTLPLALGTAGVLFPTGGLMSARGFILLLGCAACGLMAAKVWGGREPPWALAFPLLLAFLPLWPTRAVRGRAEGAPARPLANVVLVTLDTVRHDHLGFAGYPRATSPGLDSLASRGLVFTTAYASAPSTGPSHASLFTGLHPSSHGVRRNGWPLRTAAPTLAEVLQREGYSTGAVVSVAHLCGGMGWGRGFDRFHDQGKLDALFPYSGTRFMRAVLSLLPLRFSCRAKTSVDRAVHWLRTAREPFFLWLHLWDPHDPYDPPPPYHLTFQGDPPRLAQSGYPSEEIARWTNLYDGEIRYVDEELRRLWAALRERGLESRTLVAVLSDHGESLGERSYRGHSILLYDEQTRIAFFLVGPGITPRLQHEPVSIVDVGQTILEALGLGNLQLGQGSSLLADSLPPRPVRFEVDMWGFVGWGARQGPYKAVTYRAVNPHHPGFAPNPGPLAFMARTELYRLDVDPQETDNLASTEPRLVEELTREWAPLAAEGLGMPPGLRRALRSLGYVE